MTPLVPYEFDAERFSRWMSYVLRHNPVRYGLQPDRHGYVDLDAFLLVAQQRYRDVPAEQLRSLIEGSGSGRFEITGTRLRARYGHSIAVEPAGPAVEPPPQLYHGVAPDRVETILMDGLSPMDRRMIHLSETLEDALAVARRKTEQPVVLRIHAQEAHAAGAAFYREGKVYLASQIPARFLSQESLAGPSHTTTPPS